MTEDLPLEYGELAELYEAINDQFIDYDEQAAFVREAVGRWRPEAHRVLDVGCATGPHARRLAAAGFEVVGADLSERLIQVARRRGREEPHHCEFLVADGAALPFDGAFDVALCLNFVFSAFLTNHAVRGAAEGMARALRPGGVLVMDHHAFFPPPKEASAGPGEILRCAQNDSPGGEWEERCRLGEVELAMRHRQRLDYFTGICDDEMLYRFLRGETVVRELPSREHRRVMLPQDLLLILAFAGFETLGCFERWNLARPSHGPTMAVVARKRRG